MDPQRSAHDISGVHERAHEIRKDDNALRVQTDTSSAAFFYVICRPNPTLIPRPLTGDACSNKFNLERKHTNITPLNGIPLRVVGTAIVTELRFLSSPQGDTVRA